MPEIIIDSDDNLTGANVNSDGLMVIRAATILNQGYGDFYAQMRAGLAGSNEVTGLAIIGKIDNEIGTVWKGGGGGGGDVSSIVAGLGIGITPVSGIGDVTINLAGQSYTAIEQIKLAGIATGAEVNPAIVSFTEAIAGTSTIARLWTAQRVEQAIGSLAPVRTVSAGAGIFIDPIDGTGDVTVTATGGGGTATVFDTAEFDGAGTAADPTGLVTPYTSPEKTKLAGIATGAEVNPAIVSFTEAGAGTSTIARLWTAQRVGQAIDALGGGTATVFDTAEFDGAGTAADPTGLVTPYTSPEKTKLAGIATGAEVNPAIVSFTEAGAGTSTIARLWTAQRVGQAIGSLTPVTRIVAGYGTDVVPASGVGEVAIDLAGESYTNSEQIKLGGIDTGAQVNAPAVSQADAEAGTLTNLRLWSPVRVNQAIAALAPVTSIVAGAGIFITPASGIGDVRITATGGGGTATIFDTSEFDGAGTAADPTGLVTPFTSPEKTKLAGIASGAGVNPAAVTRTEAEAGTSTNLRLWTPFRVNQAIAALAATHVTGDGVVTAAALAWDAATSSVRGILGRSQGLVAIPLSPAVIPVYAQPYGQLTNYLFGERVEHGGRLHAVWDTFLANGHAPTRRKESGWLDLTHSLQVAQPLGPNETHNAKIGEIHKAFVLEPGASGLNQVRSGYYLAIANKDDARTVDYLADVNNNFSVQVAQEIYPNVLGTANVQRLDNFALNEHIFQADPVALPAQVTNQLLTIPLAYSPADLYAAVRAFQRDVANSVEVDSIPDTFIGHEILLLHDYTEGVRRDVRIQWGQGQGSFNGYSDGRVAERVGSVNFDITPVTFIEVAGGARTVEQVAITNEAYIQDIDKWVFEDVEYDVGVDILTHFGVFERNVIAGPSQQLAGEHALFNIKRLDGTYRFNNASEVFHPRGRYRWNDQLVPPAYEFEDGWAGFTVYSGANTYRGIEEIEVGAGLNASTSHEGKRLALGASAGTGGVTDAQLMAAITAHAALPTIHHVPPTGGGGNDNALVGGDLRLDDHRLKVRYTQADGGFVYSTPGGQAGDGLELPRQDWNQANITHPLRVVNRPNDSTDGEAIAGASNERRIMSPHETRINANAAITSMVKRYARDTTHLIQATDIDPSVLADAGVDGVTTAQSLGLVGASGLQLTTTLSTGEVIDSNVLPLPSGGGVPSNYQRTQVAFIDGGAEQTPHVVTLSAEPTVGMDIEIVLSAEGQTQGRTSVLLSAEVFRGLDINAVPVFSATADTWGDTVRQVDVTTGTNAGDQIYVWRTNVDNLHMAIGWRQSGTLDARVFNVSKGGGGGAADGVVSGLEVDFPNNQLRVSADRTVGTSPVRSPSIAIPAGAIPDLPASIITTGHLHAERLGTGTADSTTVLYGDHVWRVPAGGGGGFDIHDDVTAPRGIVDGDHIVFSAESVAGDPMRYATAANLADYMQEEVELNAARITAGQFGTARIANNAITTAKIANEAITHVQLAADSVDGDNVTNNTLGPANLHADNGAGADNIWAIQGEADEASGHWFSPEDFRVHIGADSGDGFDIHDDLATLVVPANSDRIAISDENVTDDPMGYTTIGHVVAHVSSNVFLNANRISSGTMATARLGSGDADATKFLRGDQAWAVPDGVGSATHLTNTSTYSEANRRLTANIDSGLLLATGDAILISMPTVLGTDSSALTLRINHGSTNTTGPLLNSDLTPVNVNELIPRSLLEAFLLIVDLAHSWVLIEPTDLTVGQAQDATDEHFGLVSGQRLRESIYDNMTEILSEGSNVTLTPDDALQSIGIAAGDLEGIAYYTRGSGDNLPAGITYVQIDADGISEGLFYASSEHLTYSGDMRISLGFQPLGGLLSYTNGTTQNIQSGMRYGQRSVLGEPEGVYLRTGDDVVGFEDDMSTATGFETIVPKPAAAPAPVAAEWVVLGTRVGAITAGAEYDVTCTGWRDYDELKVTLSSKLAIGGWGFMSPEFPISLLGTLTTHWWFVYFSGGANQQVGRGRIARDDTNVENLHVLLQRAEVETTFTVTILGR